MIRGLVEKARGLVSLTREMVKMLLRRPVLGIVAVALDAQGRLVLIRRHDTRTFGLPGGMVDWGETLEAALTRELHEETGRRPVRFGRMIGVYSDPKRDPRLHSVAIVVEVEVGEPDPAWRPNPLEVLDTRAFPLGEIPSPLAFDSRRMLDDWRRQIDTILA
jgi:8-oxo-dGTP diphosphatase